MALDRQIIQNIRLKRQTAELAAALKVSQALAEQLVEVSGLKERGIDPSKVQASPQDLPALLELAARIEAEEAMLLDDTTTRRESGRRAV